MAAPAASTGPAASATSALGRALASARWYVASVMGDNHYEQYVARRRREHPDCPVPTEREYWRARMDAQDTNPQSRCC